MGLWGRRSGVQKGYRTRSQRCHSAALVCPGHCPGWRPADRGGCRGEAGISNSTRFLPSLPSMSATLSCLREHTTTASPLARKRFRTIRPTLAGIFALLRDTGVSTTTKELWTSGNSTRNFPVVRQMRRLPMPWNSGFTPEVGNRPWKKLSRPGYRDGKTGYTSALEFLIMQSLAIDEAVAWLDTAYRERDYRIESLKPILR